MILDEIQYVPDLLPYIKIRIAGESPQTLLLILIRGMVLPVEIKLTATPTLSHIRPLIRLCRSMGGDIRSSGILVCRCSKQTPMPDGHIAMPWKDFSGWLAQQLKCSGIR